MRPEEWIVHIPKEYRKYANEAVAQAKLDVLDGIKDLEKELDSIKDKGVREIGIQRGYTNVRALIQS